MDKKCNTCKLFKPLVDFGGNITKKDGLQSHCLECGRKRNQLWYKKNKKHQREKVDKRRLQMRDAFAEFKSQFFCEICGESESCCLEFHHDDPTQKEFALAVASNRGYSWETILKEVKKCRVLCSNCHKKFHAGLIELPSIELPSNVTVA